MGDHGYYIDAQDWPAASSDLDAREVFATLDGLDIYHDAALRSFQEASDA